MTGTHPIRERAADHEQILSHPARRFAIDNERHLLHRLAWLWMRGVHPRFTVEHINGDRSDNRWKNAVARSFVGLRPGRLRPPTLSWS